MGRVVVDRDSVSMGDDVNSHAYDITVPDTPTLADALAALDDGRFLAGVEPFLFVVRHREHGPALAVMRNRHVRYLVPPATPLPDPPVLHFEYHIHDDMTALWNTLAQPGQSPVDHVFGPG